MIELILSSLYLILPAYVANMCPVIAGTLKLPLGKPINTKLFGSHKTWRGFYAGYLGALLILFIQQYLHANGNMWDYALIDYANINVFFYALLFGLGAVGGDIIKSFFKRRLKIKSGAPWFPFDQIDLVLGSFLFLLPVYVMPWQVLVTLLILTPVFHFATNLLAYTLGMKDVWW